MGKQGSIHDEDGAVEHQDIFTSLYNQSIGHMKADVRKSAKSKKKKTSEDRSTSSQKSTIKSSLHHLKSKKKENITRRMRSQSVGRGGRAIQKPPSPIIPPKPQDSLPITSHGDKGKESKLIHSYSYLHSTRSSARKRQSQILKFDKQDREQMLEEIEEDKEVMLKAKNYPKQQDSSLSSQSRISEFEYDSTSDEEGSHGREVDEEDNDMISDFDVDNASLEFNSEEEEGVFDDHSQPVEGLHVPKINKKSREIEQRVPFGVNKRLFMKSIRKSSTKSSSSRNTHSFKPTLNKTTLKLTQNRSSIDVVNRLGTHEVMERKHRQQRRLSQREDMFKVTEDGKPLFQPQINETQLELQSPMDSDDEEEEDEQMGRQVEEEEGKGESDPSNCMDSQSVISDAKSYNRRKGGGVRRRRESCVSQLFKDAQEIEHRREERRRSLVMESQIVLNSQKMNKSNSNKMMSKAIRREVGDLFHVLLWSIEYQKMKDGEQESKKPNEVENDEKDEKEGGEEGKNEEKNSNLEYLLFSQENQEGNKNGDGHEKWRDCQLQFELIDIESINPDLHPIIHQMALIIMTRAESNNEELNPSHFLLDFDSFLSLFQRACKSLHYPLNSLLMTQTRRTKEIVRAEENKALENQLTFQPTLFTKKSYIKPAENKRGRRKKKKKGEENENDDSNSQKKSCSQRLFETAAEWDKKKTKRQKLKEREEEEGLKRGQFRSLATKRKLREQRRQLYDHNQSMDSDDEEEEEEEEEEYGQLQNRRKRGGSYSYKSSSKYKINLSSNNNEEEEDDQSTEGNDTSIMGYLNGRDVSHDDDEEEEDGTSHQSSTITDSTLRKNRNRLMVSLQDFEEELKKLDS